MAIKIGINGYGRIGRLTHRALLNRKDGDLQVVAINGTTNTQDSAYLLRYDSNYGPLDADVMVGDHSIAVNGREIAILSEQEPRMIPWGELGVDVVMECTGKFRSRRDAAGHLERGAEKVLISCPAEEVDATIVLGVNEGEYEPDRHHLISASSCTTVCLAPVCKLLHEQLGMESGLFTTVHSYTNDQRMTDGSHPDPRRGRSGASNVVPTGSGAARSIGELLPGLKNKLDGTALRVPTPTVSVADLTATFASSITTEQLHETICSAAKNGLAGVVAFTQDPVVSSDLKGHPASAIIDGDPRLTFAGPGLMAKIMAWYDNEWSYASRLADLAGLVMNRHRVHDEESFSADSTGTFVMTA